MLSISETKRAAAASAAAQGSRDVVKRFWLYRSSEDSFFQVVSLYVVGKDLYEQHSRRAIVQWVSCNLYQSGRIVFPCNVRQRPDIVFDRSGLQIVFFVPAGILRYAGDCGGAVPQVYDLLHAVRI